jgi:hypothetical protein
MAAIVAGLVLLPAVTFAVAKSRPHRAPTPAPHVRSHTRQTAPALSI